MAANPNLRYSIEDYLAMERDSEVKHEYFDGEIFMMARARPVHNRLSAQSLASFVVQLRGHGCFVSGSDQRVRTGSGLYTYPDITIVCGKPQFNKDRPEALLNPTVVIEVLSATTADYDRGAKFKHYRTIAGLQAYVLIDSREQRIELFERTPDASWRFDIADTPEGAVEITSIGCTLTVAEVYDQVTFEDEA
jgi:Uma2 family endonuclease